jgi:hypothetical protein
MSVAWLFMGAKRIAGAINNSHKSGLVPKIPKQVKKFVSVYTGEIVSIDDVKSKKHKRNKKFNLFKEMYLTPFQNNQITILSGVVNTDVYTNLSAFFVDFKKKLKRNGIELIGNIWIRDVGHERFIKHAHFLFATKRILGKDFNQLLKRKKTKNYSIKFCEDLEGIVSYFKEKELYGTGNEKSYGRSQKFILPIKEPDMQINDAVKNTIIKKLKK